MKIFLYETRHLEPFKDISIIENEQEIKELCLDKLGSFLVQGHLTPIWHFDYNLRFQGLISVKLVSLESIFKEISNDI